MDCPIPKGKNGGHLCESDTMVEVSRVTFYGLRGIFYLEGLAMNRLIKVQLELEEWRKALGTLLDVPAEDRSEDFNQKLETAKANITTAQADLHTAAQAEPATPEHRQDNPAGAELRAMEERANVGELYDSILSHGQPHGAMAELQQHLKLQSNQIPLSSDNRLSRSGPSLQHPARWGRISKG